jgi:hypothetical protein
MDNNKAIQKYKTCEKGFKEIIRKGDIEAVRAALEDERNGPSFDSKRALLGEWLNWRHKRQSFMDTALKCGNIEIAKLFVEYGYDVLDCQDGQITFCRMIRLNQLESVKFLLEHGAKINYDDSGPLCAAARSGHFEMVKFLVEKGAKIAARTNRVRGDPESDYHLNSDGEECDSDSDSYDDHPRDSDGPISEAIRGGNMEILKYLLGRYDFSLKLVTTSNDLALLAAECGNVEMVHLFMEMNNSGCKRYYVEKMMDNVFEMGNANVIEYLYKYGVDISKKISKLEKEIKDKVNFVSKLKTFKSSHQYAICTYREECFYCTKKTS